MTTKRFPTGVELAIDTKKEPITRSAGIVSTSPPVPAFMQAILDAGGLRVTGIGTEVIAEAVKVLAAVATRVLVLPLICSVGQ